jgi:glycosyltransferase involved in cell wall biosynthesis
MLSVIIPAFNEPYLQKTIDSLLENATGEIEVIPVLDGWWPDPPLTDDDRVRPLHLGKSRGMRDAINAGVSISRGEFVMRTDAHCIFAKGFDKALTEACQPNWIITAKRFCLDPIKWEVMPEIPAVEYEELVIQSVGNGKKFTGIPRPGNGEPLQETHAMQGSMWVMRRAWWDKVIAPLQSEGYGTHLQDSHEMSFKTWKAGGKLYINKDTWFAHKHVSFPRTHNYGGEIAEAGVTYCFNTWVDYYRELKEQWKRAS